MKHQKLYRLVLAALFAALIFVATNIIHIPTPGTNGYVNLGDCMVLLGAFLLGPVYGAAAGGIGSALADILSGYAVFAPGTFVIKALIAVIAAVIMKALGGKTKAAFTYAMNRERYLRVFLEDGDVPMDNNASERAIQGFCIGKNYAVSRIMFCSAA